MKYLKCTSFLTAFLLVGSIASTQDLKRIDVSGENAPVSAPRGKPSYTNRADRETEGRNGGDAPRAQHGGEAGALDLKLQHGKNLAEFFIFGTFVRPGSYVSSEFQKINVEVGSHGFVNMLARGGNGQPGGIGGDAQAGGHGVDGRDASASMFFGSINKTRSTPGTDGANSGYQGAGSNGGNGTDGGKISVTIPAKDSHLAMLVRWDVDGGRGGEKGRDGDTAPGGRGGKGGSSFSGSFKIRDAEKDAEGNIIRPAEYESVYLPGSSDGRDGRSLKKSTPTLYSGRHGSDGSFVFRLKHTDGNIIEYKNAFKPVIQSFKHRPLDDKIHFYEPGRQGLAYDVVIKNEGDMPMPKAETILTLVHQGWVVSDSMQLVIPPLQPGESITLADSEKGEAPFRFDVRDIAPPKPGPRLETNGPIRFSEFQSIANRYFENPGRVNTLRVSFPVEISEIISLRSLKPGEMSEVVFEIRNITDRDFGKESNWGRQIFGSLGIAEGSEVPKDLIEFYTFDGQKIEAADAFTKEILKLGPKGSTNKKGEYQDRALIRLALHLKPEASEFSYKNFSLLSWLGIGDEKKEVKTRQYQVDKMTVVESFKKSGNRGDWLLLASNSLTDEELSAFKQKAKQRGRKLSVWDLSLYGYINLTEELSSGGSLAEYFKDGLIILPNHEFDSGSGEKRSEHLLAQQEFIKSAAKHNLNLLILGRTAKGASETLGSFAFPHAKYKDGSYRSPKEFLGAIQKQGPSLTFGAEHEPAKKWVYPLEAYLNTKGVQSEFKVFSETYDTVEFDKFYFFGSPKAKDLAKAASDTREKFSRLHPGMNMHAVMHFDPKELSRPASWWRWNMFKRWKLGYFEVRRGLDLTSGQASALEVPLNMIR